MSSWFTTTLGKVCNEVGGTIKTGPFGSQLHQSDYQDHGTPVVMPKNITERGISTNDIARIGNDDVARLAQHKLQPGDIVYGRRGDIGRCALIGLQQSGWLCGTGCLRLSLGNTVLLPSFLFYYLRQPTTIKWIYNQAVGATMPNLNTSILRSVPVSVPPLPTQRKIAYILSAYDDLIENNLRRIKILEEMAQNLYREWFVKFRFPGHEKVKFVDSPLGKIPEGWEVLELNKLAVLKRKNVSPQKCPEEVFEYFSFPAHDKGKLPVFERGSSIKSTKYLVPEDCVLVPKLNPHIPRVWFPTPSRTKRSIASTEYLILEPLKASTAFLYSHFSIPITMSRLSNRADGTSTSHRRLKPKDFMHQLFPLPQDGLLAKFTEIAEPALDMTTTLRNQSANLRQTRDLLLPKLISGKLDVSDLDIKIPEETA